MELHLNYLKGFRMFTGKYLWGKKIENFCNATVIKMSLELAIFFDSPNKLSRDLLEKSFGAKSI